MTSGPSVGLIDSHAHLSKTTLTDQVEDMLVRAQQARIQGIVNICTDVETLQIGLELSRRYPWIYQAAAITPHDVDKIGEKQFPEIARHAREGKLVAVGETGLDYHYYAETKELQKHFLKLHLSLARECQLPVVIHCREAFADFFEILDQDAQKGFVPGVLHCFTGTIAEAQQVIQRNWYLSLSGIATFKKSTELREVARLVPLDKLLIETDTPYLAPQSKRGKTNEPAFITEVAALIAELRRISYEELVKATARNAQRLFGLA
jgi:TatD DNase family protein